MINLKNKWIDRARSTLAFFSLWTLCLAVAQGQPTNQVRYAIANKTEVYCGPGEDYYVTSLLRSGAAVDVFHHTKNGWCAIRPPDGSFCWLAAENAYLLPGGTVAEVVGDRVPAWIGSSTSTSRQFKWQVELQPSQQVRILGEAKQKIDQDKERLWYRIAPPQGEFRWVKAEALSERAPIADPNDPPIENAIATSDSNSNGGVVQASTTNRAAANAIPELADVPKSETKPMERAQKPATQKRTAASSNGSTAQTQPMKKNSGSKTTAAKGKASGPETPVPRGLLTDFLSRHSGILPKKAQPVQDNGVQQAQYVAGPTDSRPVVVNQRTEPVQLGEGEYVVGSEEVVADRVISNGDVAGPSRNGAAVPYEDHGTYVQEGDEMIDEPTQYIDEGPVVSNRRSSIHLSHADDPSLNDWNALNSHPGRVLVRPLNGILGLVGFGIAESEMIPPSHTSSHIISNSVPNVDPSMASRLDSLPRPSRRAKGNPLKSLLQPSDSRVGYQPEPIPRDFGGSGFRSSILESSPMSTASTDDWHARSRSMDTSQATFSTSTKTNELEPMQLSTPQLQEAFFELTKIVALPTDQWDFRQVHQYASDWVERGASVIERGEARLLQERIQQFESLRLKINGNSIATLAPNDMRSMSINSTPVNQASYSSPVNYGPEEAGMSTAHQADASGKLSQVFTSRPGQPEFALTDANGGVVAYVVPSPGMNLRRYLDQPIAIYGTKGYLPELASKQIVADRVVRLR